MMGKYPEQYNSLPQEFSQVKIIRQVDCLVQFLDYVLSSIIVTSESPKIEISQYHSHRRSLIRKLRALSHRIYTEHIAELRSQPGDQLLKKQIFNQIKQGWKDVIGDFGVAEFRLR